MSDTLYDAEFILAEEMINRERGEAFISIDPVTAGVADTADGCIAVLLESDDLTKEHPAITTSVGKRVRILITVEDVEPESYE